MNERFANLRKVPKEPAARLLAMANAKLATPLSCPASAPVSVVLEELETKAAVVDMIRLMSVCLPPRERTWWACLATREMLGKAEPTPSLIAAEQWVRKPGDDTRAAARTAVDTADSDDDTTLCATSVMFHDGKLGTGDLAHHLAPPGAAQSAAFGMVVLALGAIEDDFLVAANRMIDRALDIARGGSGQITEAIEKEAT